ncbi:MAG: ergothioneine biosynthesis protein EgtB [Pseudomonadota bacterium]
MHKTNTADQAQESHFAAVRQHSVDLCAPLAADDFSMQPIADVSPPKWHLAHTSWFFETFLLKARPDYREFDPRYEVLFNSYYNGVGRPFPREQRGTLSRPTTETVYRYREHVDAAIAARLGRGELDESLLTLGCHHEQQHQELLLTDMKYILGQNPLRPAYCDDIVVTEDRPEPTPDMRWLDVSGGIVEIGTKPDSGFCFDNETPRHRVWLDDFRIGDRLITNGEFLAFIDADGYRRSELWLSEGWAAVQAGRFGTPPSPLYWHREEEGWFEYQLTGDAPLDLDAPVSHVSHFEADAYARWRNVRLPTETEWEIAAERNALESPRTPLRPTAARRQAGERAGMQQTTGSLWQWTASAYLPYPGYRPLPGTVGEYNGKFMNGQMVLRGASVATPPGHDRLTYRNFFYSADRWQFTGIRLASDARGTARSDVG